MGRLARLMAWAELRGGDRGLRGPSGAWLAVWVIATAYRHLRRTMAPEQTVVREVLAPGERIVITHYDKGAEPAVEPRRGRRRR